LLADDPSYQGDRDESDEQRSQDVKKAVARFLALESSNFSLCGHVNAAHAEIERLERSIDIGRAQLDALRGTGLTTEAARRGRARETEERIHLVESRMFEREVAHREALGTLNVLRVGIHNILTRAGLLTTSAGGAAELPETSLLPLLGLIEQRAGEALLAYASSSSSAAVGDGNQEKVGLLLPQLQVVEPSARTPMKPPALIATEITVSPLNVRKGSTPRTPPLRHSSGRNGGLTNGRVAAVLVGLGLDQSSTSGVEEEDEEDQRPFNRLELEGFARKEIAKKNLQKAAAGATSRSAVKQT
jgi:hypothetical protein